ncbi:MAG: hypothetical protein ACKESB_03155 [Candidatus Hodgkinia cicadicola]
MRGKGEEKRKGREGVARKRKVRWVNRWWVDGWMRGALGWVWVCVLSRGRFVRGVVGRPRWEGEVRGGRAEVQRRKR